MTFELFNNNKDSTIVYQEKINLEPTYYSKNVEAFRIKYLSDGYIVAGFIVKPKNIDRGAPILIFNRGGSEERFIINNTLLSRLLSFWASQGYVVLASQYRGNDGGEGQDEFGGSDINDAGEINVPTLILHGGKDWRVPIHQAKEFVHKLEEAKKEYRFIEYPDGDHGLRSHFKEYSGEILKWFDR
jgi:dipeptidyl aminopeptidase/acylaminoacyl peptidase